MNIPDLHRWLHEKYPAGCSSITWDSLSVFSYCAVRMTQKLEKIHPPEKLETENSGICLPAFGFKITGEKLLKFTKHITQYCKN
jgi:hypothetical protein